ncbi:hypothetical protein [Actinocrispum wychmicini]|uniref:Methylmalonyl-CoA mutase cobalamin-binding domain/chain n=1 Tax=Actinocrispum wychmicini TaxID=1213861 RepID=A0A4R2JY03_9PSEU|nr:hypothetical protein [Actinocrispum wychmicini]TCO65463.1 methylmalonyl-CoA mutase cobalamin-binding domain/chain [Actinocrispum wychmicini]
MTPIRVLLVELEPDDLATRTLARALRDEGAEVVYTSAHTAAEVAATAAQEDVRAVGFVVRSDEHRRMCAELAGQDGIVVFATVEEDTPETGGIAVFRDGSVAAIVAWAEKLG